MNALATPRALGYRWPAEWESHTATWIAWPHRVKTWPGRFESIPARFAEIVRVLAQFEPVSVLAGGPAVKRQAEELVGDLANVTLYDIPTNDAWVRDYGPTFLQGPGPHELAAVDWQFNSWGGKYPPWDRDNAVAQQIAGQLEIRRFAPVAVMEGGSIDGNGCGVILTTRSCLLDPRRNAGLNRQQVEELLRQYCGATEVIWIAGGPMAGDDTDGHVDQLARFVSSHRIAVAVEDNPQDENYQPLQTNLRMLQACCEERSEPFEIIPLPMPQPVYFGRQRAPASYCNFYIANRCVLVPQYDDAADLETLKILQPLFPERQVIGIPARDLVWGLGSLHCLTQQQPAARDEA